MAANYDIAVTAGLDASEVTKGAKQMDREVKAFSSAAEREFKKVGAAQSRIGKGPAASKIASSANQIKGLAEDLGGSEKASKAISEHGAEIGAMFGPGGAIIGGVIALGAAMWNVASGAQAAEVAADRMRKAAEKQMQGNVQIFGTEQQAIEEKKVADEERLHGKEAAAAMKEQLDLTQKIRDVRNSDASKGQKEATIDALQQAQFAKESLREKQKQDAAAHDNTQKEGEKIANRAKELSTTPTQRAAAKRASAADTRAQRRAAEEQVDREQTALNKESGIGSGREMSHADRRARVAELIAKGQLAKGNAIKAEFTADQIKDLTAAFAAEVAKTLPK